MIPVFPHGRGKTLPCDGALLMPFFCDVFMGENTSTGEPGREIFMQRLQTAIWAPAAEGRLPPWG